MINSKTPFKIINQMTKIIRIKHIKCIYNILPNQGKCSNKQQSQGNSSNNSKVIWRMAKDASCLMLSISMGRLMVITLR